MILLAISVALLVQPGFGQGPVGGLLLRMYAQNGLPFREEVFIDNLPMEENYDFIIVGASPSGSVLANRLSENPAWKVLLLEAGMEGNIYTDIPAMNPLFFFTNYNWRYKAEPQSFTCLGSEGGVCSWPSGKGVGGATIWNGLMWTRCHPKDFDEWESFGNPGWNNSGILPYFLKVEKMTIPDLTTSPYHSTKGKVAIDYPYSTKLVRRFINAGKEMGYKEVDYNNPKTPLGFSRTQITAMKGKRVSAATAYLAPVKERPNLHIVKNAFAKKVIINPNTKEAEGVEFVKNGRVRVVKAKKDVILSAGAFNTPVILMLSGVGPSNHLKSKNVTVLHHLPAVGQHLQEHVSSFQTVHINASESLTARKLAPMLMPAVYEWMTNGKGILGNNVAEGLGYIKTRQDLARPDIELIFSPITMASDDGALISKYFGVSDELYKATFDGVAQKEGFTIGTMLMHPESKGSVSLRSNNPFDPPVIITNFLSNDRDVKTIIAGQRFVEDLVQTKTMREIGAKLYKKPIFGCENHQFGTNAYYECSVRHATGQLHHQCCTARMGPNSKDSVVDARLRVHGIRKLRVADASVMPKIPGAHTMAVSYAIGEKAADLFNEDWKSR